VAAGSPHGAVAVVTPPGPPTASTEEARRWGRPDRDRPRRSCRTPRRHFPAVLRCLSLPAVGAACPGPRCCSAASPRLAA
jgi:hypothetical protein